MTQVDTGMAAPASAPAASAPAPSTAPAQTQEPRTIAVPVDDPGLAAYGGRWGELSKAGREYRQLQEQGIVGDGLHELYQAMKSHGFSNYREFLNHLTNTDPDAGQTAQPAGEPSAPQSLTLHDIEALLDKREQASRQQQQQTQFQRDLEAERHAVSTFVSERFKSDQGLQGYGQRLFDAVLEDVLIEDAKLNDYVGPDKAQRIKAAKNRPATSAQLDRAKQLFDQRWSDLTEQIVAHKATQQAPAPPATLGGGAGGSSPPPNPASMTAAQQREYVLAKLRANKGRR